MAKVIRILVYEGSDARVRETLSKSLPLGTKEVKDLTISVYEHSNDLPKFWGLHPDEVKKTIAEGNKDG